MEMENLKRLEEQKAREEKVKQEKQAELAEKQRKREAELEEKARKEKEEAIRGAASSAAPAASSSSASGGGKFVPAHLRGTRTPAAAPSGPVCPLLQLLAFL